MGCLSSKRSIDIKIIYLIFQKIRIFKIFRKFDQNFNFQNFRNQYEIILVSIESLDDKQPIRA